MNPTLSLYLAVSLRMAIVIAGWIVLRFVLRNRIPMRFIVAGWALIFAALLLPLRWSTPASPFNLLPSPMLEEAIDMPETTAFEPAEAAPPSVTAVATPAVAGTAPAPTPPKSSAATPPAAPAPRIAVNWRALALYGWLAGTAALFAVRIRQWRQHRCWLTRCSFSTDQSLNEAVAGAARDLGISARVRVLTVESDGMPAVVGLFRPSLLFPAGFAARLSPAELYLVIMHELGHWRRRDLWLHELAHLARAIHWFNPMVWLAVGWLREDSEAACDEFVMHRMTPAETSSYGSVLLKVVGFVRAQPASPVGLGIFGSKQKLKLRILMIARYARPNARQILLGTAAVATLLATCLTKELHAQDTTPPASPSPSTITTVAPPGWSRNGQNNKNYTVGVDFTQTYSRPSSAYVMSNGPASDGDFGGMMQSIDAAQYLGKRLRFSAWMKSVDAAKGAQLWMRIDGDRTSAATPSLRFDNMAQRPHPKGTTDWQRCEVVLDVPMEAVGIFFGFFVTGEGTAWVNDARLEVVGTDVPTTEIKPKRPERPAKPQNLEFTPAP